MFYNIPHGFLLTIYPEPYMENPRCEQRGFFSNSISRWYVLINF